MSKAKNEEFRADVLQAKSVVHTQEVALLFWNVRKLNVTQSIVRLTQTYAINVLVLAEFNLNEDGNGLLTALNEYPPLPHQEQFRLVEPKRRPPANAAMNNVQVYTRFPLDCWELHTMHNRYAVG